MPQLPKNDQAIFYFHQGTNFDAFDFFGAHRIDGGKDNLAVFRVWAPHASAVNLVGDFNGWNGAANPMTRISANGVFECAASGVNNFDNYKYEIISDGTARQKSDPYGFHFQTRPENASKFFDLNGFEWGDSDYIKNQTLPFERPINIYEVHLGSWRIHDDGAPYSYRELAEKLPAYAADMGYTHIELMPVSEHPYDGSWGYQVTGYYAPTSRFGTPHDFMYFVDCCHRRGIGVILDWVPAHFPKDDFALAQFDGGCCYEYSDPYKREHKEWGTLVFDYSRPEVQSFLVSNACFWLSKYHIDGLRVDAVASMLYLDYGRKRGGWRKNAQGGRENLEAVAFLKKLNTTVFARHPHALMCAEESTAWPLVTGETHLGGLGFNYKWNMGWMNDVLSYVSLDPLFRSGSHSKLTFSMMYAFSENFILPISHDEVVHGKCSLIQKMPGDYARKFAGLRTFFAYMYAHPGKKLSFMGNEFAQFIEWNYEKQLDWLLLDYPAHAAFSEYIRKLNHIYLENAPLWEIEKGWDGFRWLNADDSSRSIVAFERTDKSGRSIAVICNFSGSCYGAYEVGVPDGRRRRVLIDAAAPNYTSDLVYEPLKRECCGLPYTLSLNVEPLNAVYLITE